jgi:amidase
MRKIKYQKMTLTSRVAMTGLLAVGVAGEAWAQRKTTTTSPAPVVTTAPAAEVEAPTLFQLENATIDDIHTAMANGSLTSVELTNLYLRRIQAYDQSSVISPVQPLNSVAAVNPALLDDAATADLQRKQGASVGPLHGIPFLVKWSYSIKDMPITGGTNGWRDLVTHNETWSVAKMREAGAIVMGHANMDTWASSATTSSSQIKGAVRSSYLQGAYPGGSSGGSGVSSGAYLTNFAFGGETGGSIRNPGDRNGLVAYKVSGGSISVNRIIPLVAERDVIGPMTRNAQDNALIRDVVGVTDPDDFWNPVLPLLVDKLPVPQTGFKAAQQGASLAGKKIGIIGTYVGMTHPNPGANATSNTTSVQTTTSATLALVQSAKAEMEAAGATVSYVFLPPECSTTYDRGAEAPKTLLLNSPYSDQVASYAYRGLIESIVAEPGDTYSEIATKVLATANLVSNISATRRNMMYTLNAQTGEYEPGTAISLADPSSQEHYRARAESNRAFEAWMDAEGLDAVVWPVWPNKGRTSGSIIGRDLVNYMFLPAVTVPMGRLLQPATSSLAAGEEPLTLNITGRLYDDQKVLAIAYAYQQATKHRYSPPLAPALTGEKFDIKRQQRKAPSSDILPPVLTVASSATVGDDRRITFTGSVADSSTVDRLEVSVAGSLIPAVVEGNTWTAVLPAESSASVFIGSASSVNLIVLAVDTAGNAACSQLDVVL